MGTMAPRSRTPLVVFDGTCARCPAGEIIMLIYNAVGYLSNKKNPPKKQKSTESESDERAGERKRKGADPFILPRLLSSGKRRRDAISLPLSSRSFVFHLNFTFECLLRLRLLFGDGAGAVFCVWSSVVTQRGHFSYVNVAASTAKVTTLMHTHLLQTAMMTLERNIINTLRLA